MITDGYFSGVAKFNIDHISSETTKKELITLLQDRSEIEIDADTLV